MSDYRPVLFLDTNALHYAMLYIEYAIANKLPPIAEREINPIDVIANEHGHKDRSQASKDYIDGLKIVEYLRYRCKETSDISIRYSPFSCMEYSCCRLKGQALLSAVKTGAPDRFWSKFSEEEIFHRLLNTNVYDETKKKISDIVDVFQKAGISIEDGEIHSRDITEIFEIARKLLENIFLDTYDCIIYANALFVQAEKFITADGYLRRTIQYLYNPGSSSNELAMVTYRKLQQAVKQIVAEVTESYIEGITLPEAPTINALHQSAENQN